MKFFRFFAASVLLASSAFAQFLPPINIPPGGTIFIPVDDPVLANVNKTKSYSKTYGLSNANIQVSLNGYGTVFAVQDETQVLARATTGAKVEGLARVLGSALLGATARVDADAANATWSYSSGSATVTSETDNAKAVCFVKVGPYTLVNETKSYSGDVVSSPSFVKNYTKHIFDVHATYPVVWPVDVTVYVGADAGAALTFTGTLDPLVVVSSSTGSKAKLSGIANGWVSGTAYATFGVACFNAGLQVDLRLANSGFNGSVTAERDAVSGSVGLTEQPLAVVLKIIWSYCLDSGSYTIWSWASSIYSVNYAL